ncbi:MAG: hypothetical protein Q9174_000952 [Haloplaca sp. 1 TL-2023]
MGSNTTPGIRLANILMTDGSAKAHTDSEQIPFSLSSLILPTASRNLSKTLSSLQRSTLSITNRLSSIHHDSLFTQEVACHYKLPLIANERCGSWYIPPELKVGSAYFKSTDGHQGQWSFSTRRLNLQVLDVVSQHEGCIIVDSTRRGKSMPDALSKTIPIWCAVINRLLFDQGSRSIGLNTPKSVVSPSEHSQVENRIDGFVEEAKLLNLDTSSLRQKLTKPLEPLWLTPDLPFPSLPPHPPYHPIICFTCSHRVHGAENSEDGYIQGAGDDSEGWSLALTPNLFWQHKDLLMSTPEEDLPSLIGTLLTSQKAETQVSATLIRPTDCIYLAPLDSVKQEEWDAIIVCDAKNPFQPSPATDSTAKGGTIPITRPRILHLPTPPGKLGSRALRNLLHLIPPFLASALESSSKPKILFSCATGKDLFVGAVLVALCLFFNDDGSLRQEGAGASSSIDKVFIRQRLAWITTSNPNANPSRETLQAVNSYLLRR